MKLSYFAIIIFFSSIFLVSPNLAYSQDQNVTNSLQNQITTIPENLINLGTEISNFIKESIVVFKEQRDKTIEQIKKCREDIKNSSSEEREQKRFECREKLDTIRDSYKERRDVFKNLFKEYKENAKILLSEVKRQDVSETQRKNSINNIIKIEKDKITKQDNLVKEERQFIKDIRKLIKKESQGIGSEQKQLEIKLKNDAKEIKKQIREIRKTIDEEEFRSNALKFAEEQAKILGAAKNKPYKSLELSSDQIAQKIAVLKSKSIKLEELINNLTKQLDDLEKLTGSVRTSTLNTISEQITDSQSGIIDVAKEIDEIDTHLDDIEDNIESQIPEIEIPLGNQTSTNSSLNQTGTN